ncbi:MAG: hypothetical protein LLF83_06360 [Methanobacterium sp.]|nr:hypothetical protein [Methanobacterium sp.]
MEIITFVKGKVSDSKIKDFKNEFGLLKNKNRSDGEIKSYLLQDTDIKDLYIIETIWESHESLDRIKKMEIPIIYSLFNKVGSKPVSGVYGVIDSI